MKPSEFLRKKNRYYAKHIYDDELDNSFVDVSELKKKIREKYLDTCLDKRTICNIECEIFDIIDNLLKEAEQK